MQKLQERVAKTESLSSEALKATQAESARATQAEAARYAQTEAVVDSLLVFKQTQAAELAKRDAAIAELHTLVVALQGQLQQQGLPDGQQAAANGQSHTAEKQQEAFDGQSLASDPQQEHQTTQLARQKAAVDSAKGRSQGAQKAAIGPSKSKDRHSLDVMGGRHAAKVAIKPKGGNTRAHASVQRGASSHLDRDPLTELPANEVRYTFKADLGDCHYPYITLGRSNYVGVT